MGIPADDMACPALEEGVAVAGGWLPGHLSHDHSDDLLVCVCVPAAASSPL